MKTPSPISASAAPAPETKREIPTHIPEGNKRLYRFGQALFILILLFTLALAGLRWWT